MKEADLYPPLKQFLEAQGYSVKGEVKGCDVVAVRGAEDPVIVELKLTLNLEVLLQAVERLSLSPTVYLGVPEGTKVLKKRRKHVLKLLRMLGLGLVVIEPARQQRKVTVLLDPSEYRPRQSKQRVKRLLGEFANRVGDPTAGGSETRKGIMTAYRQRALVLAKRLLECESATAADLAKELQVPDARAILYRNVYGWFDRPARGKYAISPRGRQEVPAWQGSDHT